MQNWEKKKRKKGVAEKEDRKEKKLNSRKKNREIFKINIWICSENKIKKYPSFCTSIF